MKTLLMTLVILGSNAFAHNNTLVQREPSSNTVKQCKIIPGKLEKLNKSVYGDGDRFILSVTGLSEFNLRFFDNKTLVITSASGSTGIFSNAVNNGFNFLIMNGPTDRRRTGPTINLGTQDRRAGVAIQSYDPKDTVKSILEFICYSN